MSEKKNKKILKLYNVALDDIDNKGNINPDAKLLPFFNSLYHINHDDVKETLSSEDWYDDKTNVHKDRHFYIDLPDGRRLYQPVKHRGYSALSYYTKPDRADSLFDDWHHDKKSGKDDNSIRVYNRDEVMPKGTADKVIPGDTAWPNMVMPGDTAWPSRVKDEDDLFSWVSGATSINKDRLARREEDENVKYDKSDELNYMVLPVIADIDDEDIIRLHDVLNNNYDPGRDSLNEVQVKHLRNKVVPQGWLKVLSKDYMDNLIDNGVRGYFTGKFEDNPDFYDDFRDFDNALQGLYGYDDWGKSKYESFKRALMSSYELPTEDGEPAPAYLSDKYYDTIADFLHNEVAEQFKSRKGNRKFALNSNLPRIIRYDYFPYDDNPIFNTTGGVTVSDKHYKQIIDDLYDDVQNDKTRSNITNTLMEAKYV